MGGWESSFDMYHAIGEPKVLTNIAQFTETRGKSVLVIIWTSVLKKNGDIQQTKLGPDPQNV